MGWSLPLRPEDGQVTFLSRSNLETGRGGLDTDCDGHTDEGLGWASPQPLLTSLLLTLHSWGLWGVHRDPLPSCLGSVNWSFGRSQARRACFAPRPGIGVEGREKQKETGQRYSVILGETPRHPHTHTHTHTHTCFESLIGKLK